jgi:hypothetical protein
MKNTLLYQLAAGFLIVTATERAYALDAWQTEDDFSMGSTAFAKGVRGDGTNVYVIGYGTDTSGARVAIVRRRALATSGFSTVDSYAGDGSAEAQAIAIDPVTSTIYVAGKTWSGSSSSRWYVRSSTDGGTTWNVIHIASYYAGGQNSVGGILQTQNGLIVTVEATDATHSAWVVKRFNGTSWGTLDAYMPTGQYQVVPGQMSVDGAGNLLVTGWHFGSAGLLWETRKLASGVWSTVDTVSTQMGFGFGATASFGALYTAGGFQNSWITRKSTDGGATWTTVDSSMSGGFNIKQASGVKTLGGYVYVCGIDNNAWAVRKGDASGTWTDSDKFSLQSNPNDGTAYDLAPAGGRMWVVGSVYDASGISRWAVRSLTPTP